MLNITAVNGTVTVAMGDGLSALAASPIRLYRELGELLQGRIRAGFEREQAPDGTRWTPLKPSTVRQRKGDAHPILQRKGRLKRITSRATAADLTVGTNLPYAPAMQFGAEIVRKDAKLHFRRVGRGGKKGVRFARENDKRAKFGMRAGPYTIRIPARPFMFNPDGSLPDAWLQDIKTIVLRRLEHTNG